jgi:hypothetical protein
MIVDDYLAEHASQKERGGRELIFPPEFRKHDGKYRNLDDYINQKPSMIISQREQIGKRENSTEIMPVPFRRVSSVLNEYFANPFEKTARSMFAVNRCLI